MEIKTLSQKINKTVNQESLQTTIYIEDFGGKADPSGSVDNTPPFNQALIYASKNNVKTLQFGGGDYYFKTPPETITAPIEICGYGKGRTLLYRLYNASSADEALLSFRPGAGSSIVRDLGIVAYSGYRGGSAISLIASSTRSPDFCSFQNILLTSAAASNDYTWDSTVYIDGSLRSPVGGVRDTDFIGCSVFGGKNSAMNLTGTVAFNFFGGGIFQAGGLSGAVVINGSPTVNSYYTMLNTGYVGGIAMEYCQTCILSAGLFAGNITNTNTAQNIIVIGKVTGVVQSYWTNSRHIDTVPGTY